MGHRLSPEMLLTIWETGAPRRPLDRALAILWAAGVDGGADLSLAARDRALLAVRAETFGAGFEARATCPKCAAELDVALDAEVLADALSDPEDGAVRPMTSTDMALIADLRENQVAGILRERLAGRVAVSSKEAAAFDASIEAQAAEAEISLKMVCAECDAAWAEILDVAAFVWAEIEVAALQLLSEVGELARAFGWNEDEILSLSKPRRAAYVAMVRAS